MTRLYEEDLSDDAIAGLHDEDCACSMCIAAEEDAADIAYDAFLREGRSLVQRSGELLTRSEALLEDCGHFDPHQGGKNDVEE